MSHPPIAPFDGVAAVDISRWASRWNDTGLWSDVLLLADRVWGASAADERVLAWHHLLMAVGNFKRQGGRRIMPAVDLPPARPVSRTQTFDTPTGMAVNVEALTDWQRLQASLVGIATPTCTTLLAALWPGDHFVFDWRVRAVASGVLRTNGFAACPSIEAAGQRQPGPVTMEDYHYVRAGLRSSDLDLVTSERAFYEISRAMTPVRGRTWEAYGAAVLEMLGR